MQDPTAPKDSIISDPASEGAYVLCEGLWGMGNSSIARYDKAGNEMIQKYFSISNPERTLGDLANDLVILGDTALVVMTSAGVIEAFSVESGESFGRITFPKNSAPREVAIINDSTAVVSDLYLDKLHFFNPKNLKLIDNSYQTGPAPESVVYYDGLLFAANSGYGYYRKDEEKAGTISVIDYTSGNEIKLLSDVKNAVELLVNEEESMLYCCYHHITAAIDTIGGIVEYDINTLKELRRWHIDALAITFSRTKDSLYFIADNNVYTLALKEYSEPALFIENNKKNEIWYSLSISPFDDNIWVCNARDHQINGEIIIYEMKESGNLLSRYNVGVNPAKVVFF